MKHESFNEGLFWIQCLLEWPLVSAVHLDLSTTSIWVSIPASLARVAGGCRSLVLCVYEAPSFFPVNFFLQATEFIFQLGHLFRCFGRFSPELARSFRLS